MRRGRAPVLLVGVDLAWGEKKHDLVYFYLHLQAILKLPQNKEVLFRK